MLITGSFNTRIHSPSRHRMSFNPTFTLVNSVSATSSCTILSGDNRCTERGCGLSYDAQYDQKRLGQERLMVLDIDAKRNPGVEVGSLAGRLVARLET